MKTSSHEAHMKNYLASKDVGLESLPKPLYKTVGGESMFVNATGKSIKQVKQAFIEYLRDSDWSIHGVIATDYPGIYQVEIYRYLYD